MTWQLFWQRPNNAIETCREPAKPVGGVARKRSRGPSWFFKNHRKSDGINLSCPTLSTTESSTDALHWNDMKTPKEEEKEEDTVAEPPEGRDPAEARDSEPRLEAEDLAYDSYRPATRGDDDSVSTMTVDDNLDLFADDESAACLYVSEKEDSLDHEYLTNDNEDDKDSYLEATPETVWQIDILDHMLLEQQCDPHAMPIRQPLYFRIYFPHGENVCYMGKQVLGMVQDLIEFNGRSAFSLRRLSNNEVLLVPCSEVLETLQQILHESSYLSSCPEQEYHRLGSGGVSQCAATTTTTTAAARE